MLSLSAEAARDVAVMRVRRPIHANDHEVVTYMTHNDLHGSTWRRSARDLARCRRDIGSFCLLLVTWVPLVILSAFGDVRSGGRVTLSLLVDYTVYVRFLLAMPVLVLAEGVIWPRVVDLFHYLVRGGVVAEAGVPALEQLIKRFDALRPSWMVLAAAAVCVVFGMRFLRTDLPGDTSAWQFVSASSGRHGPWPDGGISLSACRFFSSWLPLGLAIRYLVRLSVPSVAPRSRADAHHPDRSAGLRPIGQVHQDRAIVVFAISSLVSVHVGLELFAHGRSLLDYRLELAAFLGLSLVVLFAPFLAFSGKLLDARQRGLLAYGRFAAAYAARVRREMARRCAVRSATDLLGTGPTFSRSPIWPTAMRSCAKSGFVPFEC